MRSVWAIGARSFKGAHFATFPPALPEVCIKADTSDHGACAACGAPYTRVVEKGGPRAAQRLACGANADGGYDGVSVKPYEGTGAETPGSVKRNVLKGMVEVNTVGWVKSCTCASSEVRPCVVLDPFGGSGTTSSVAERLGRDSIYIDINCDYEALARARVESLT